MLGVINKFVDNLCHFLNNPKMKNIFACKITSLTCYKLQKYFSDIFTNMRVIIAMVTSGCRWRGRSKTFSCLQLMQHMYKSAVYFKTLVILNFQYYLIELYILMLHVYARNQKSVENYHKHEENYISDHGS